MPLIINNSNEEGGHYWLTINQGHSTEVPDTEGDGNIYFDKKMSRHVFTLKGNYIYTRNGKGMLITIHEN